MQDRETKKTLIFVAVAALALIVAWEPWRKTSTASSVPAGVGSKLFEEFKDPLAAKSLEVIKFDETTATIRPFKVAQANGRWSIPSHSNYPADANQHMADAATALVGLDVLNVQSDNPGDRELYGVITPDPQKLKPGMVGVGTRVTLKDDKDKVLADLVIGKEVKDQPTLRYVRQTDRDQICKVKIQTDKLSTKFEDWIEKDLLKLSAFDVREVALNDYSTQEGVTQDGRRGIGLDQRTSMKLGYDDAKTAWNVVELSEADQKGQLVPTNLADDEELNTEKLNALKTALDDLQIVDVEKKPAGLSQDLRSTEEFVRNVEAMQSLRERGFYLRSAQPGVEPEIYSSEGEAKCTTKDGVRYVLRFGSLAGGEEAPDEKAADGKEKRNPALNRFLFVMAQFDESQIPKPQLEDVPGKETPATEEKGDDKSEQPADAKPADDKPATEGDKAEVPEKKTSAADDEKSEEPAADAEAAKDEKPAEEKKDAAPATPEDEKRIAIERENKRKTDEYNDAVKKGQDKVKELNDRFADWYFIISDDVYKKIHLGRADIAKKKEAKADDKAKIDEGAGKTIPSLPTEISR